MPHQDALIEANLDLQDMNKDDNMLDLDELPAVEEAPRRMPDQFNIDEMDKDIEQLIHILDKFGVFEMAENPDDTMYVKRCAIEVAMVLEGEAEELLAFAMMVQQISKI